MARISSSPRKRRLFSTASARRATSVGVAAGQIVRQLRVRPRADAPCGVRSYVVGLPAVDYRTREFATVAQPIQEIPRCMAFAAMAERLDEIGAPVPFGGLTRVGLKALSGTEQPIPEPDEVALVEWK